MENENLSLVEEAKEGTKVKLTVEVTGQETKVYEGKFAIVAVNNGEYSSTLFAGNASIQMLTNLVADIVMRGRAIVSSVFGTKEEK